MTVGAPLETVRLHSIPDGAGQAAVAVTSMTGRHVTVVPDPPLPRKDVIGACRAVADEHDRWRPSGPPRSNGLLPEEGRPAAGFAQGALRADRRGRRRTSRWSCCSATSAARAGRRPVRVGQDQLPLALIGSLAARYTPDELEFYLLDFKEGVSFARFAPGRRTDAGCRTSG